MWEIKPEPARGAYKMDWESASGKLEVKVRLADCRPGEGNGPSARGFCLTLALMGLPPDPGV